MTGAAVMTAFAALWGLAMGSAVTAIVWRLPRGISWARGRSRCTSCDRDLGAADLVPVLSWLAFRGRCRGCGARIAVRYPVIELTCLAWAVLLFTRVGASWVYLPLSLWGFLLVALTWIDYDHQLLPDALTLPGTLIGVWAALMLPNGARHAMFGMLVGAGILWVLGEAWLRLRGIEAMGFGDVKLALMFGAVLGAPLTLLTLMVAAFAGALWGVALMALRRGGMQTALPFGTLLAPAAMVSFLWGDRWFGWYLGLLRP